MRKKLLWTVVVLVLIAAVLVGAYFLICPDGTDQNPEQHTEQNTEQFSEQTEKIPEPTEKKTDYNVVIVHKDGTKKEMTLEIVFDERPQQTEDMPAQQTPMPNEGSYDEWFDYFRRFFGN